jgi:hypothetical protein
MRRRAIIGALLLIVLGVALGATVFRTDIAQATGLAQAVTIDNTSANPVPVREQNTTAFLGAAAIGPDDLTLDVSPYREIRLVANRLSCTGGGDAGLSLDTVEGGQFWVIETIQVCFSGGGIPLEALFARLKQPYEIPGRTLRLRVFGDASVGLAVFGRAN